MILHRLEEGARGSNRSVQPRQVNQQIDSIGGQWIENNEVVICDIVSSEGDLDQCVKAHMIVYIVLKLCVDVEG